MEEGGRILLCGRRGIMKHEVDWFKCIIASFSSHWTSERHHFLIRHQGPGDLAWQMSRSEIFMEICSSCQFISLIWSLGKIQIKEIGAHTHTARTFLVVAADVTADIVLTLGWIFRHIQCQVEWSVTAIGWLNIWSTLIGWRGLSPHYLPRQDAC